MFYTFRALRQVERAGGFRVGALLPDENRTYWTMTGWDSEEAMRAYMLGGAHKKAMRWLFRWCDEASVAHWSQAEGELPSWSEADNRMRTTGRASKVRHPSSQHLSLSYRIPRASGSYAIRPR